MNVLVDTSVWSLAIRRRSGTTSPQAMELERLIADRRVQMTGPIRQEILSGIREAAHFRRLQQRLAAFPDIQPVTDDYVQAARFFNRCRANGVQGSNTDFLLCALAEHHRLSIYTTDRDFFRYAKYLPVQLHVLQNGT